VRLVDTTSGCGRDRPDPCFANLVSTKIIRILAVAALAGLCAAVLSAVAFGRTRAHADLRVTSGSAHVVAHRDARPVLSARFRVDNTGTASASHFRGWVQLAARAHVLVVRRYNGGALGARHGITLAVKVELARTLAQLDWTIEACVVLGDRAKATPATDGCRRLGTDDLAPEVGSTTSATTTASATPTASPTATATPTTTPTAPPPTPVLITTTSASPPTPVDTVPPDPVSYTPNQWFFQPDGREQYEGQANTVTESQASQGDAGGFFTSGYWAVVPPSYDASNQTPETLLVWMHGCEGSAEADAFYLTNYSTDRPYIVISLNGPEGEGTGPSCWDTSDQTDSQQVLADIASAETHFNINPRRVIIAGYSSGGDLAYQTIFLHADMFAGILAVNTDPVRDNTFADNLGAAISGAAWKFPIVHVMHVSDTTYPPSTVQPHLVALQSAGFAVTSYDLPGTHYDADAPAGCDNSTPATCTSGLYFDIARYLTSSIATDGWAAPAS
jgi:predicted esterase